MASWKSFASQAPELAQKVKGRFAAHGLGTLATIRRDGSPRLSGVEPMIALDELWVGMMRDSVKSRDVRRDPRMALHSAGIDKDVTEGDAKVSGVAELVTEPDVIRAFATEFSRQRDEKSPEPMELPPMDLYRIDITEATYLIPVVDHLEITFWRDGVGASVIDRF